MQLNAALEAQHAALKAQHAALEAQKAELEAQKAELKAQKAELKAQNAQLLARYEGAITFVSELTGQNDMLKEALQFNSRDFEAQYQQVIESL